MTQSISQQSVTHCILLKRSNSEHCIAQHNGAHRSLRQSGAGFVIAAALLRLPLGTTSHGTLYDHDVTPHCITSQSSGLRCSGRLKGGVPSRRCAQAKLANRESGVVHLQDNAREPLLVHTNPGTPRVNLELRSEKL